jgi:hypothetical protein
MVWYGSNVKKRFSAIFNKYSRARFCRPKRTSLVSARELTQGESEGLMANVVIAIATVVIAIFAIMSYRLGSKIQSRDEGFRQQISDLYQAVVISSVITGPQPELTRAIRRFKVLYKGTTPIHLVEEAEGIKETG